MTPHNETIMSDRPAPGLVQRGGLLFALSIIGASVLAFWNVASLLLTSTSARADLGGLAWFMAFASGIYGLAIGLLLATGVLIAHILDRIRSRAGDRYCPTWLYPGMAATITALFFGFSVLAGSGPGDHAAQLLDGFIVVLAAISVGIAGFRTARWINTSGKAPGLLPSVIGFLIGFQGSLISWVIVRDHYSLSILSPTGIALAGLTLIGGIALGVAARHGAGIAGKLWAQFFLSVKAAPAVKTLILMLAAGALFGVGRGVHIMDLLGPKQAHASSSRPNVLLIVTDTLRADYLGSYGSSIETPNMDALAASGTRLDPVYATASWTGPTTGTILTGLYPSSHGFQTYQDRMAEGVSIANVLKDAGYATAGITANPVLTRKFGFGEGFGRWENEIGRSRLHPYRSTPLVKTLSSLGVWKPPIDFAPGSKVVDVALDWLQETNGSPFFLHLQFMDPHDPYIPPEEFLEESPEGRASSLKMEFGTLADIAAGKHPVDASDLARLKDLYAGTVRYMDSEIGRLIKAMRARGQLENTLIVLTSDHGEEFIDHDGLGHEHTLYEELVRIPLIFSGMDVMKNGVLTGPAQQLDIAPTILEATGLSFPAPVEGRSIWKAVTGREELQTREVFMEETYIGQRSPIHAFRALRQENWKLIGSWFNRNATGNSHWELFDLLQDPGERQNVSAEHPEVTASMRKLIEAWASRPRAGGTSAEELDEETLEQLRSLGYVE